MIKNNYFRYLQIDFPFDKKAVSEELLNEIKFSNKIHMWKKWGFRDSVFSDSFHNWLNNLGCYVANAEIFYIPLNKQLEWHIDMYPPNNFVKINFVWNSDNHVMMWGECTDQYRKNSVSLTQMNTEYVSYEEKEIKLLEMIRISEKFPSLVNVGIPHKVINSSFFPRWCFSVIPHFNNKRILFDDAIIIFKDYIIN
jgi:hypothetical protein